MDFSDLIAVFGRPLLCLVCAIGVTWVLCRCGLDNVAFGGFVLTWLLVWESSFLRGYYYGNRGKKDVTNKRLS